MSIRLKLILNLIILFVIIGAVCGVSYLSLDFIKGKLFNLTEKSTPFQIKTMSYQRAIHALASDLIRVASSSTEEEYRSSRSLAEKSLEEVRKQEEELSRLMGGEALKGYEELKKIADELFSVVEQRIKAEVSALEVQRGIETRLKEATKKLKDLDAKIKAFQLNRQALFASTLESSTSISAKLRNLEGLKVLLKDLQIILVDVDRITNKREALIVRSKANSLFQKALQNPSVKESKTLSSNLKALQESIEGLMKHKMALLEKQSNGEAKELERIKKEATERLSSLLLSIEADIVSLSEKHKVETARQDEVFTQANIASNILLYNSELMSLGLSFEALANRFFTATSTKEVEAIANEVRRVFESIDKVSKNLEKMLSKVNAKEEIKVLQLALSSLNAMKGSLLGEGGVYGKVYLKLTMREKSNQISERLREIIVKQVEKSKEVVTSAQGEQEKAISEVNKVARDSRMFIVGVSSVGIFVGVLFGFWVYRSISKPLRKLVEEMTEIAQGNLTCVSTKFSRDEIGTVRKAMCKMVENISEVVGKLQATTKRVTEHSENLSAIASLIEIASTEQEMEIDQAEAAVTEMSHTIQDISNNVAKTAEAASKMREKAMKGKEAMWTSTERLKNFIETVRHSAESVESLSQKSEEINNIIALIMKIAEQTKLLALNAGIEAARAGAYGKGFAVVADNIKELSSRTVSATNEISSTISTIQNEISRSVQSMVGLRSSIEKVIEEISMTVSLMDEIVGYVEEVAEMVQSVAVALKEQSTAAVEISKTVDKISQVTKDLRKSIEEINQAASDFIKIADELHRMASWFKV